MFLRLILWPILYLLHNEYSCVRLYNTTHQWCKTSTKAVENNGRKRKWAEQDYRSTTCWELGTATIIMVHLDRAGILQSHLTGAHSRNDSDTHEAGKVHLIETHTAIQAGIQASTHTEAQKQYNTALWAVANNKPTNQPTDNQLIN